MLEIIKRGSFEFCGNLSRFVVPSYRFYFLYLWALHLYFSNSFKTWVFAVFESKIGFFFLQYFSFSRFYFVSSSCLFCKIISSSPKRFGGV